MRGTDLTRCVLGVALLAKPRAASTLTRTTPTPGVILAVQVLAVRYLTQSLLGERLAPRWHADLDVAVDAVHAGSMVVVAGFSPRHRRLASVSAVVAATLAVADAREVPGGVVLSGVRDLLPAITTQRRGHPASQVRVVCLPGGEVSRRSRERTRSRTRWW